MNSLQKSLDSSTAAIIENSNKGFNRIEGELVKDRSARKLFHRENQQSFDEIMMSAKKTERVQEEMHRKLNVIHKLLQNSEGEGISVPRNVTTSNDASIHGISAYSLSESRACSLSIIPPSTLDHDEAASVEMESMCRSYQTKEVQRRQALSSADESFSSSNPTHADMNLLRQQNAELRKALEAERQKNVSVTVEKMQTAKQLQIVFSPSKRKAEEVIPRQSTQTASEQKAEMKYYQRRKSGFIEQMHGRNLLESERVQTSRPATRSRTRAAAAQNH